MEFKDNCCVCQISMIRGEIVKIFPCNHMLHSKCLAPIREQNLCPLCRGDVHGTCILERNKYKKHNHQDRKRIIEAALRGDNWKGLAETLDINYKTAHRWVMDGRIEPFACGGKKPKLLNEEEQDLILKWIEEKPSITLQELKIKVQREFQKWITTTTISNNLNGKMYTMKSFHYEPVTMNNMENKQKRAKYVEDLNNLIRNGKQVIWIDETNFNLFCRRTRGWSRRGSRAVTQIPTSRGPNVHLIGGISSSGVILMTRKRGSFKMLDAREWVTRLLNHWEHLGNHLEDLVLVCDNAPCHSQMEIVFENSPGTLLRLAPYSPILNPIECIWSKIKTYTKTHLDIPNVHPPGVCEQRLVYLENIIDEAKATITASDCARAVQHSTTFYQKAIELENMPVGE